MAVARCDLKFAVRKLARRAAALPKDSVMLSAGGRSEEQANLVFCETKVHAADRTAIARRTPYGSDDD